MINEFIEDIRNNIEFLYMEKSLIVRVIQVSKECYIELQREMIQVITRNICEFKYKEPIEIDGIPVVINKDIGSYNYELVVSIPSYRFKRT